MVENTVCISTHLYDKLIKLEWALENKEPILIYTGGWGDKTYYNISLNKFTKELIDTNKRLSDEIEQLKEDIDNVKNNRKPLPEFKDMNIFEFRKWKKQQKKNN